MMSSPVTPKPMKKMQRRTAAKSTMASNAAHARGRSRRGGIASGTCAVACVEHAVDELHTLHAAVVLVGDLVLPCAEAAPREDAVGLEPGKQACERLVAAEERRRVAV